MAAGGALVAFVALLISLLIRLVILPMRRRRTAAPS